MTPSETPDTPPPSGKEQRPRRYLPRFGLRTLFVFGILFCLFFAWAGKHLYRVRQEQAAIEALKQAGANFQAMTGGVGPRIWLEEVQPFDDYDPLGRLLGRAERPVLSRVELRSLQADDPKVAAAIAALALFPEIDSVSLEGPGFDDESLAQLSKLPRLETVALIDTRVAGAGFSRLGQPSLQCVVLLSEEPSPELIAGIASLPNLDWLSLQDNEPTEPSAYDALEKAQRLKTLYVQDSGFDDEDMKTLAKLEGLEQLAIDGIDDVGLARLAPLAKLTWLRVQSPVTKVAAREFSGAHPDCPVQYVDGHSSTTTFVAGDAAP
ncbi:MAG TPA: hypothetical protein VGN57_15870 [Pirellulaceae bacterium]|jgi:hypothetical protein|nr:hypothetical protein [Pirellulaceae bacterium]